MSEKFRPAEMSEHVRIANELDRMVIDLGVTARDVGDAVLAAVGKLEEGTILRPDLFQLSLKMKEALDHGLTKDELLELIKELAEDERSEIRLEVEIEGLHITDEEKELLRSIVNEKRMGKLIFYEKSAGDEVRTTIIDQGDIKNRKRIIDILLYFLGGFEGFEGEIKFIEFI